MIIETGSIKRAPGLDPDVVKREVECRVKREREIERIIERRKLAWSVHEKCKTEWKPSWNDKRTADEVCAPNLVPYRQLVQEVKDRQARDECVSVGVK